ncbi:hypothetical protein V8E36_000730 [Tilletia maclaganii]
MVKPSTIQNCWRHCDIRGVRQEEEDVQLEQAGAQAGGDNSSSQNADVDIQMEEGNDQGEEDEEEEDDEEEEEIEVEDEDDEDEVEVIDAPSVKLELSDTGEVIDQRAERDLAAAIDRLKIHSAMDLDFILNPPGENDEPIITEADAINGIIELLQQSSTEEEPEVTLMEQPKVSLLEGLSAAKALGVWVDQQDDLSPEQSVRTRLALRAIERAIRTRQTKSAKQTSITQFFASSRAGPSSSSSRS